MEYVTEIRGAPAVTQQVILGRQWEVAQGARLSGVGCEEGVSS
jgi:hypothetical protein